MNKVKYLLTYRYAEIIHDLTVEFTKAYLMGNLSTLRNLSNLSQKADYRQVDQMNQAARSGKQNIVEGVGQSQTSKSGEIKLLGVSEASFEELLSDFEDFLRQRGLALWGKDSLKAQAVRRLTYTANKSYMTYKSYIENSDAEIAANTLICLVHQENYLLDQLLRSLEKSFMKDGGFTERLYNARSGYKSYKPNRSYRSNTTLKTNKSY